jgi:hypothetical protein
MIIGLRVFHKDGKIIHTSCLDGYGRFPYKLEEEKKKLNCDAIEITDKSTITNFLKSDTNSITDGKVVTGQPRISTVPTVVNLVNEITKLKADIAVLQTKVK